MNIRYNIISGIFLSIFNPNINIKNIIIPITIIIKERELKLIVIIRYIAAAMRDIPFNKKIILKIVNTTKNGYLSIFFYQLTYYLFLIITYKLKNNILL